MNRITKIILFAMIILAVCLCYNNVYALTATATASPSATEIKVGDTVTINVSVTAGAWNLSINGGGLEPVGDTRGLAGQTSTTGSATVSKSYTFKATKSGDYTITLNGDITDYDTNENKEISKPIQIKVNQVQNNQSENPNTPIQPETPNTPTQPETSNNPTQPETPKENPDTQTQPETPNNPTQPETTDTPQQEEPKPTTPEITFTEVNKKMYVTSENGVWLRKSCKLETNDNKDKILAYKTEVTVLGEGSGWYKVRTLDGKEGYVAGYLTAEKPSDNESSVASLSSLKVNNGNLNETFSSNTLSYTMTVEATVDAIDVQATPTDSNAKVKISGNTGLKTGTGNIIYVIVTAEDGISSKTYKIVVTKLATEDEDPNIIEEPNENKLGLKSLEIEGIQLSPKFKNDVYEYTATLTDKTIEKLKVDAVASIENSKVEITGEDNIKDGDNIVTITVTSENGEETVTYKITVTKKEEVVATTVPKIEQNANKGNEKIILVVAAIVAIIALILIFVLIKKKEGSKTIKVFEDGDYNEEDDDYIETENKDSIDNNSSQDEEYNYEDDDDDDNWGTPKRGLINKFRKTGRHF